MINKTTSRYKREGRYTTWWLTILHQASLEIDMDVVEEVAVRLFEEYKTCATEENNEDVVVVIGKTKVRKRFSTLSKQVNNELMNALERVGDAPSCYSFRLTKSDHSYRSTKLPSDEVLSSSSEVSEYEGDDIRMLNDPSKRTPWQVLLLEMISDDAIDDFVKPDDRTLIWIHDYTPRGGADNSIALQRLYDQCLSHDLYVEVIDKRVATIIRKMLKVAANQPVLVSAPVYLLAILKSQHVPLVLQTGGNQLIISNFKKFMGKSFLSLLSGALVGVSPGLTAVGAASLLINAVLYAWLKVNCHVFVQPLPPINIQFQYIETMSNQEAPVIVTPAITNPKPLYHKFEDEQISYNSLTCSAKDYMKQFVKKNDLGPDSIEPKTRQRHFKKSKFVPLSQRTKTLRDLHSPINEVDEIDVNSVNYKTI